MNDTWSLYSACAESTSRFLTSAEQITALTPVKPSSPPPVAAAAAGAWDFELEGILESILRGAGHGSIGVPLFGELLMWCSGRPKPVLLSDGEPLGIAQELGDRRECLLD